MIKEAYDIFFATLANINRLEIINALRKSKLNVTEIAAATGLNQTTISHNLKRLLRCGFVKVTQKGKHRYYRLNNDTIKPVMAIIDRHIKKHCSKLL